MTSKLITNSLKFILILVFIYGLFELVYSQNAQLTVPSDVRTETIILNPQNTTPGQVEGRIYYNNTDKRLYYSNGTDWRIFGGPDKAVATRVVSAYNSSGATRDGINPCLGDGSTCNNIKADYTCDGTADQAQIQQAIDDLGANPGAVYLLEGTYNISDSINLDITAPNDSGKAIIGTGRGTVLKVLLNASNVNLINALNVQRILISQLMIDGNSKTGSANNGIYFDAVTYSKIDKVWIENMVSNAINLTSSFDPPSSTPSSNNTISNNNVANSNIGVLLGSVSSNNIVSNNNIQNNSSGWGIMVSSNYYNSNNIISNNNISFSTNYVANRYGIRVGSSHYNIISNNNIEYAYNIGIDVNSAFGNIISNNNIHNNGTGINLYSESDRTVICNNNINNNRYTGINVPGSSYNTITGNVISDNGGADVYSGILLSGDPRFYSSYNIISSNRISDSTGTGYGIDIPVFNCTGNYLSGNLIDGLGYIDSATPPNYDRRIKDSGSGTKYTDKAKLTLERTQVDITAGPYSLYPDSPAPKSYIALNPSIATTLVLANGNAAGNMVILENIAVNTLTLNTSATVKLHANPLLLNQNDILTLIWNGSAWVEIGDNLP